MTATPHPRPEQLAGFSLGRLDEAAAAAVAEHLSGCSSCREMAEKTPPDTLLSLLRAATTPSSSGPTPVNSKSLVGTADLPRPKVSAEDGSQELPEVFGRYQILKKLGQGGMGAVYLARDTQLDRQVALKVPRFRSGASRLAFDRFVREARAAAALDHPNLCPVYDVGCIDGIHYLTMPFLEGKPLNEFVQPGKPLPPRQVVGVVRKLALALQEAHARGVVHRDLKPANVMINRRKEPVVMDFGLVRLETKEEARLTASGVILGTPAYMPPEQVLGEVEKMGPACDVYSLGVILYELLTGQLPFQGPTTAVLAQVVTAEPKPPSQLRPEIDPTLEAICLKAMSKAIEARYGSMAEFASALTAYLKIADGPVSGGTPAAVAAAAAAEPVVNSFEGINVAPAVLSQAAARRPRTGANRGPRPPQRRWPLAGAAALAGAMVLGAVVYVVTNHGRVKIELNDPKADVQVKVDGDLITLQGPEATYRFRAGSHSLEVSGNGFKTRTQQFTVRRGETDLVEVKLEPNAELAGTTPPQTGPTPAPPVIVPGNEGPSPRDPGAVLALIEKLGGKCRQDFSIESKPIIDVNLLHAKVKDADLQALANLTHLEALTLGDTRISDTGLAHLKGLTNLQTLDLGTTDVTNAGLANLKGLTKLRRLELYRTTVSDAGLASLSGLSELRTLGLEGTRVGDPGLAHLQGLTRLEALNLGGTKVTDAGLDYLKGLTNIREFHVHGTEVSDAGKKRLQAAWTAASTIPSPPVTVGPQFENSIGMKLIRIPAGEFLMGAPDSDKHAEALEKPQHRVKITRPFYLGVHEVTVAQFKQFVTATGHTTDAEKNPGPSGTWRTPGFTQGDDHPVVNVSFNDAMKFCQWLSAKEGKSYHLPTEAEWEYACRANTTTRFWGGETEGSLQGIANLGDQSLAAVYEPAKQYAVPWNDGFPRTAPVGKFRANAFGLYDTLGNAWEWCSDWNGPYSAGDQTDPTGPTTGDKHIVRGGGWGYMPAVTRCSKRGLNTPESAGDYYGFRVALTETSSEQVQYGPLEHAIEASGVAFSRDGKLLATASRDGGVKLWDLATGKERAVLAPGTSAKPRLWMMGSWAGLAFSPDGKWLASWSDQFGTGPAVRFWDVAAAKETVLLQTGSGAVGPAIFSPDSKLVATGGSGRLIHLWDLTTGKEVAKLGDDDGDISALTFSPDGTVLVAGTSKAILKAWTVADRKLLWSQNKATSGAAFKAIYSLAFTPDGKTLVTGTEAALRIFDPATGEPPQWRGRRRHTWGVFSLAVSADGRWVATTGRARVRPGEPGDHEHFIISEVQTGADVRLVQDLTIPCNAVAWSPDGKWVASAGTDTKIRLWDTKTWKEWTPPATPASVVSPAPVNPSRLPDGPAGSPLRFLGYVTSGPAKVVSEFAPYTNLIVDRGWVKNGDEVVQAARQAGRPVLLLFIGPDRPGIEERMMPLIEKNRDVIAGVCWHNPYYFNAMPGNKAKFGVTPAQLAEFARSLKQKFPGLPFWVGCIDKPTDPKEDLPIPDEVDALLVTEYLDTTPEAVRRKADDVLPGWFARAGKRPVVLRFSAWTNNELDMVRRCRPETLRACVEVATKHRLAGVFFDHYGVHADQPVQGIDTQPALVQEVRQVARELGFDSAVETGFKPLFNGKDLSGWLVDSGELAAWQVEDGQLLVRSSPPKGGWLFTKKDYRDFWLRLDYQLSPGANSGVAFRCLPGENIRPPTYPLEVQLLDDNHQSYSGIMATQRTGALFKMVIDRQAATKPVGSWNHLEIEVRDATVRVAINGKETVQTDLGQFAAQAGTFPGLKRPSGRIGLQNHTGTMRFRNIEIKELSSVQP